MIGVRPGSRRISRKRVVSSLNSADQTKQLRGSWNFILSDDASLGNVRLATTRKWCAKDVKRQLWLSLWGTGNVWWVLFVRWIQGQAVLILLLNLTHLWKEPCMQKCKIEWYRRDTGYCPPILSNQDCPGNPYYMTREETSLWRDMFLGEKCQARIVTWKAWETIDKDITRTFKLANLIITSQLHEAGHFEDKWLSGHLLGFFYLSWLLPGVTVLLLCRQRAKQKRDSLEDEVSRMKHKIVRIEEKKAHLEAHVTELRIQSERLRTVENTSGVVQPNLLANVSFTQSCSSRNFQSLRETEPKEVSPEQNIVQKILPSQIRHIAGPKQVTSWNCLGCLSSTLADSSLSQVCLVNQSQ